MLAVQVISLPSCKERRRRARERLHEVGVLFEFLDAYDGERGRALFEEIDEGRFTVMTGRRVQPGEIGCYASHVALWRRCVESGRPLIVLEDDFELHADFPAAVEHASAAVERYGFLRLQREVGAWTVDAGALGRFQVKRYTKAPQETLCYALSPAAARRLLAASRVLYASVDVFLVREFAHGQPLYGLLPYTVRHCSKHEGSVIGPRNKARKDLATRIARTYEKTRRLVWRGGLHLALRLRLPLAGLAALLVEAPLGLVWPGRRGARTTADHESAAASQVTSTTTGR